MSGIRRFLLVALLFVPLSFTFADDDNGLPFGDLDELLEMIEEGGSGGAVFSMRAYTMGADGELIELDGEGLDLEGLEFGELSMEAFDDLSGIIENLTEGLGDLDFGALGLGEIDFEDFDCGGIDWENFDFEDIDFEEMFENGMSVMHSLMVDENGEPIEWDAADFDLDAFGIEDFTEHLEDALEDLEDLDLDSLDFGDFGLGGVIGNCHTAISAYAVGPDGEVIEFEEGEFNIGEFDIEAFLEELFDE